MKKMMTLIFTLFLVQCAFAQKMQVHTSTMGIIEIELSKVDSITFTVAGRLAINPDYIYVQAGGMMNATITGGKAPYNIQVGPNGSIATASISGNMLTVNGVALGSTSLVVKDNSIPALTAMVYITVTGGPGGLNANPNYLSLTVNEQKTSTISGGTTPYTIQTPPDPVVATATLSGSVLTVKGLGNGSTFVVVKDNSIPYKTATVDVHVRGTFTTPGSLSFASTVGNFSAAGIFENTDSLPTNSQGVGAFSFKSPGGNFILEVVGYVKNSATNWDIAVLGYYDSVGIAAGTYPFVSVPGPMRSAQFMYVRGWNPSDTTVGGNPFDKGLYMLNAGTASLSSFTGTNAQGTFSGTGSWYVQGVPDLTKSITVSAGTFSTPVMSGGFSASTDYKAIQWFLGQLTRYVH